MNKKKLLKIVEKLDFALQPIVDINSGKVIAYESLLRDYNKVGFNSIDEVFDSAYENKTLYALDILLRDKVLDKLQPLFTKNKKFKLFYNIDNRILEMKDYQNGITKKLLSKIGYPSDFITFEISEKQEFKSFVKAQTVFRLYSQQGFDIALDDFGTGFSGLKMLYYLDPQYIKIDRFFITDILQDEKKKLFVSNIVNIARKSNIQVLAEGVETLDELNVCREVGCDLVQGFFVQKPTKNIEKLKFQYDNVAYTKKIFRNQFADICESKFNLDSIFESTNNYKQLINKYVISSSTNKDGIIINVTDAFCDISGYSKFELIGKSHNIVKNKKESKKTYKKLWETISSSEIWLGEICNQNKNKDDYYIEATISPNFSSKGKIIGYTSVIKDITYKKLPK